MDKKALKALKASKATSKKASSLHPPKTFCNCSEFCHKKITLRAKKRHYKNAGRSFSDLEDSGPDLDMDGIFDGRESE
jgi:hypothetical protein